MPEEGKAAPTGIPAVPAELTESLRLAVEKPDLAREVQIRMSVEGGHEAERYSFHFNASGAGALSSSMSCRMTGREGRSRAERIEHEDFVGLLRAADLPRLIEVQRPLNRIPPCSLIGRLEITDGKQRVTFLFMADPAQAAAAGFQMPPELARLVEAVYAVSAKYMGAQGLEAVRP
jgi:hypothetical protein